MSAKAKNRIVPLLGFDDIIRDRLLSDLNDIVPLPSYGIVCGQAVSSLVDYYHGFCESPVINDVDVFAPSSLKPGDMRYRKIAKTKTIGRGELQNNEYGELFGITRGNYRVACTERRGMLNLIWLYKQRAARVMTGRNIIGGFDFNNTQIGIDLGNRCLICTPEYRQFFKTRQLEVVRFNTPAHSAIRLMKKASELEGVYINIEKQLERLSLLIRADDMMLGKARKEKYSGNLEHLGNFMGEINYSRYEAHAGKLEKYFTLSPVVFTNKPKGMRLHSIESMATEEDVIDIQKRLFPGIKLKVVAGRARSYVDNPAHNIINPEALGRCMLNIARTPNRINRVKVGVFNTVLHDKKNLHESANYLDHDANWYKGIHVSPTLIRRLGRFTSAHHGFTWLSSMPLRYQSDIYDKIQDALHLFAKKDRMLLIGMAEHMGSRELAQISREELVKYLRIRLIRYTWRMRMRLVLPSESIISLFPTIEIHGVKFREITSAYQLDLEGKTMNHCVGSYWSSVKSRESKILSLTDKQGKRSTAEIVRVEDDEMIDTEDPYVVSQHVGPSNESPPNHHQEALQEYLDRYRHYITRWNRQAHAYSLLSNIQGLGSKIRNKVLGSRDTPNDVIPF